MILGDFLNMLLLSSFHLTLPHTSHIPPCSSSHPSLTLTDHFSPSSPLNRLYLTILSLSQTTFTQLSLSKTTSHPALSLPSVPGHSLLKVRKAQPNQRWVGAAGKDSRKYSICGEAGAELVIPVPVGTTVWLEQYQKVLGEDATLSFLIALSFLSFFIMS